MAVDTITTEDRSNSSDTVSIRDYVDAQWRALNAISLSRHDSAIQEIKRIDQALETYDRSQVTLRDSRISSAKIFADKVESMFRDVRDAQILAKDAIQMQFSSISKGTETA